MRVVIIFSILSSVTAVRLISEDDIKNMFVRFVRHELSQAENDTFMNLLELYSSEQSNGNQLQRNSRTSLNCLLCRSIFGGLFELLKDPYSDEDIIEAVNVICVSLSIVSPKICRGAVELNLPIINYIIRNTPEASERTICGLILQTVGNPNVCVIDDSRFEWSVELPEPLEDVGNLEVSNTNSKPLTIALVTDAHIDPYYEPYGVADCDEPTCCRKGQTPRQYSYETHMDEMDKLRSVVEINDEVMLDLDVLKTVKRVQLESVPATNSPPAGYWGDYRDCDSPVWAYDDLIERMASAHRDIDIVYYLGDSIDHHVWETTYEMINDVNLHVIDKMRNTFGDDILILPVIGNHESQPTNQFAPSYVVGEYVNTTWLYEALAKKWSFYLTEEAKETVRDRGEYSMLIRPGLRVISLNNNVAYRWNWWVTYDPLDAKRHLDWLIEELYKAELAGEKVHILSHIPPGVHDFTRTWTREYNRIVNRFSSTIAAEFTGHTHSDEFKIFYSDDGTPINMAWGAGSGTSYANYNLNYKIATFDPSTFEPLNIVNYIYNLTEANLTPHRRPHWFQLYDIKNSFGLQDLSASSMDDLVHRMVTYERYLLDFYSAFYSKLSDTRWPYCNDNCKIDNLCKTVVTVLWERQKCDELRGLFFS